jgi:hypothetical protein
MKLKKYIKILNELVEKNPELLEAKVIYSIDDEGNNYNHVNFGPSPGHYDDGDFDQESKDINAICIN